MRWQPAQARAGQAEIVVHVALRALHAGVRAGQREAGRGVVECRAGPLRGVVAHGAVLREAGGFVRRVGGPVEIRQVAGNARGAGQAEVVVHVALRALHRGVGAGQRETRSGVVEFSAHPLRRVVAQSAILREPRGLVIRTGGSIEIVQVARDAGRAGQVEIAVDVALGARRRGVDAGEGKSGGRMVERGACPLRGVVAAGAILREARGLVRRVGGPVVVRQVAVGAGGAGQA